MAFDWVAEARRLLDEHGIGLTSEQYIASLRLALQRLIDMLEQR